MPIREALAKETLLSKAITERHGERLKERFGILINETSEDDRSIQAGQAASSNLNEFKIRLRQLGRFESLSDEFEAQYVRSPIRNQV